MDKFSTYDTILKSAFATDYRKHKRNYHGDKIKVQKMFWSTVVSIYHKYGEIDFTLTVKLLIDVLYNRPLLDVDLFSGFKGRVRKEKELNVSEVRLLKGKIEEGEKIKGELISAIKQFVSESVALDEPQIIDLQLRKNHQPYLPSISMVVDALRSNAAGVIVDGPLYYPFQDYLSLPDVRLFRKKGEACIPYYLCDYLQKRISHWVVGQEFHVKRRVYEASQALIDHILLNPWDIQLPDKILVRRICNSYSTMFGGKFKPNSISNAIKEFKSEQ